MTAKITFEIKEERQSSHFLTYRYCWYARSRNNTIVATSPKNYDTSNDATRSAKTFLQSLGVDTADVPMIYVPSAA